MNLVIQSHESADTLLGYVERFFSEIPNKDVQPFQAGMEKPFLHHMGRIVIGEMQSTVMVVAWQTPNLNRVPYQIGAFITYLVNTKIKGSLFQVLQNKGFISASKSRVIYKMHNAYLFTIHIIFTKIVLAEVTDIIKIVYEYLGIIKSMSVEEYQTQWDNFVRIEEINFDMMTGITHFDSVQ